MLWECYLHQSRRPDTWQQELARFWRAVEADMGMDQIFTQTHEPTFGAGYEDCLNRLGYAPDPEFPRWWSKQR